MAEYITAPTGEQAQVLRNGIVQRSLREHGDFQFHHDGFSFYLSKRADLLLAVPDEQREG